MPFFSNWRMGSKFVDDCLKQHNEYRKRHGVPSLKHNKDITATAQKWAEHLAKSGTFKHSTNREHKGQKMGENIAMKWTSSGEEFTGRQVCDQWYDEMKKYNFSANSGSGTGHFTQVVWKASKEFGIGRAQAKDGKWIVVGNYFPAGNYLGQNSQNVFPADGSGKGKSAPDHTSDRGREPQQYGRTSTETSKRVLTETKNGKTVTKTIITETKTLPDGKKEITTRETVTEGDGGGASGGHDSNFDRRFAEFGIRDNDKKSKDDKKEKEKKPQKMKDFIDDVVKCHNKYRKKHGKVGDLKKNKDLDVLAQRWADHLAATKVLKHSDDTYKGQKLGENVASRWSSEGADYTGQEVTDQWYSEASKYDFVRRDYTPGAGHFSQVVWKGSKEIGVGKALTQDGRAFVVCNYLPAGNMLGDFRENVLPE